MRYRELALEVGVTEDDAEILIQALGDAMEKMGKRVTVLNSEIKLLKTLNQKHTAAIGMPVD